MPIQLTPAVIAADLRVTALAYAYEPRGDPPVPTLVRLTTYQLLDAQGNVLETRTVGAPLTPAQALLIAGDVSLAQSALKRSEGV